MERLKRQALPGVAICVTVIVVMVLALIETAGLSRETAKTFPRAVAIGLIAICAAQILVELRMAAKDSEGREPVAQKIVDLAADRDIPWQVVRVRALRYFGWVIGLGLVLWILGWYLGIAVFIVSFLRIEGRRTWLPIAVMVAIVLGVFYFGIEGQFGLRMPDGLLFS